MATSQTHCPYCGDRLPDDPGRMQEIGGLMYHNRCAMHAPAPEIAQEPDWPDVSPAGLRKMAEIAAPNNGRVFRAAADEIERLSARAETSTPPAGEWEAFETWMDSDAPPYWRTTAHARDAWRIWQARAALATQPLEQKPVGYMSTEQLRLIADQDGVAGTYIPMRKTPAGLFTLALYLGPQPEQVAQDKEDANMANGLAWAVHRWNAEVANRPLVNVHRRTLDDTWRQVIRYFEGDPEGLVGPPHDELAAPTAQEASNPVQAEAQRRARLFYDPQPNDTTQHFDEPVQAEAPSAVFESPAAKSLERAWRDGWNCYRDAEFIGEEAQNDAFNGSYTLGECINADQATPSKFLIRARWPDGIETYLEVRGVHDLGEKIGIDVDAPEGHPPAAHSPASGAVERDLLSQTHKQIQHLLDDLTHVVNDGGLNTRVLKADRMSLMFSNCMHALERLEPQLRAALATQPLEQKPADLEHIADVNYQRGEEIGYRMGLAAARRAQPEQVAQDSARLDHIEALRQVSVAKGHKWNNWCYDTDRPIRDQLDEHIRAARASGQEGGKQ